MAIEKNGFKASRFDSELSPSSRESMSSDEEELQPRVSAVDSDDDEEDEFDDVDSGAGSDDFDLLELGETGAEFCQVGNVTCSLPFELYALPGLEDVLSVDVWNEMLTEEEKFGLTKFLPDMDQDTFVRTLKRLFEGDNFHFGSPIKKLFVMLKGGLCEPRVALYREGLSLFKKRKHYHLLKKHQNSMVLNFCHIRDAWLNCKGYSIDEKLRALNIMRSQKSLTYEKTVEDLEIELPLNEEPADGLRGKRIKDRKTALKLGRNSAYGNSLDLKVRSWLPSVGLEVTKQGKQNAKGILKLAETKAPPSKAMMGQVPSVSLNVNSKPFGSAVPLSKQNKAVVYDSGAAVRLRDQMRFDDDIDYDDSAEGSLYGMGPSRDENVAHNIVLERAGPLKAGKKHDLLRGDEVVTDDLMGFSFTSNNDFHTYGGNRSTNKLSELEVYTEKPPNISSFQIPRKAKYPESFQQFAVEDQMKSLKGWASHLPVKGDRVDLSDHAEAIWHGNNQGQFLSVGSSFKYEGWNARSKKWKTGRESPEFNFKGHRAPLPQVDERIVRSDLRAKASQEKGRVTFVQNGRQDKGAPRAKKMQTKSEETESDSSELFGDEEEDNNPLMRSKSAYPSGIIKGLQHSLLKSGIDIKNATSVKKVVQDNTPAFDGISHFRRKADAFDELGHLPGYPSKARQKGKMHNSSPLPGFGNRALEDSSSFSLGKLKGDDDRKKVHRIGKNRQLTEENGERLPLSAMKVHSSGREQRGEASQDDIVYEDEDKLEPGLLVDENMQGSRFGKKGQGTEGYGQDQCDRSEGSLLGCYSVTKKRKAKEVVMDMDGRIVDGKFNLQRQNDDSISSKKKGKKKPEMDAGNPNKETSGQPVTHPAPANVELETKPQKKPYTPITPTVHTGFSFSIIHLLSSVRMAMITPLSEDSMEVGNLREKHNRKPEDVTSGVVSHENADVNKSQNASQVHVPSLAVQEIVNRVRSNPGDPCILETQEPLQDLVRGVLKIFSSKSAPLGAKGWKAFVVYEKATKSWSWIGPVSQTSTDHETMEEVTSPEYWGLPHKMLVKLVDLFANWLKSGQVTLQQIGTLPPPPLSSMQCSLDEKERFRDLRAQKSLNTISPSSEEVMAYFRREEVLRYSIPDRAFSYTAADGKKSIVAPLRRCGGKPTSKARDHFMLKRDRPPHVTILCLVRDAAARLPGGIGTRADVCTLIRDSQYIVEDVSNTQVNQIVSGALDRLHYERDPCVQFDGERKLWVYLHREREEEDFEDDGTSSTKKWKRPKKDPSDQGTVTVAFHGTEDQSGFYSGSGLNVKPSGTDDDKIRDMLYEDVRQIGEDEVVAGYGSEQGNTQQGHPTVWEDLSLNSTRESKLLCQENSTNEDFDDEAFGGEGPDGLFSESLL